MFAAIAPSYDLNNRVHSGWMDQRWRREAVRLAGIRPGDHVVDVACGTGDLTLALAAVGPLRVTGIDLTFDMLPLAVNKTARRHGRGHPAGATPTGAPPRSDGSSAAPGSSRSMCPVSYITGDALALPLADHCCDVVTIAFGIRNVQDVSAALREFRRVLRPGGRLVILEFSEPSAPILGTLYRWYSKKVMPSTATWIAGDRTGAYRYLPMSVATFLTPAELMERMSEAGFTRVTATPRTLGVVTLYRGEVAAGGAGAEASCGS